MVFYIRRTIKWCCISPAAADSAEDEEGGIVGAELVVARTQPLANPLDAAQHTVPVPPVLERGDHVRLEHRPVHAGRLEAPI